MRLYVRRRALVSPALLGSPTLGYRRRRRPRESRQKRSRKNSVKLSSHLPSEADESDTHTITAPADRNGCLGSASTVRRRQGRGRLLLAHFPA